MAAPDPRMKRLFEYAVVYRPTQHEIDDKGEQPRVIVKPAFTFGTESDARTEAGRRVPDEYLSKPGDREVLIRAFA